MGIDVARNGAGALSKKALSISAVVVVNNMTLDGVMQASGRLDEDTRGGFTHGGWASPYTDNEGGVMMQEHGMDQKNLDIYGDPPIPWSRALEELENVAGTDTKRTCWLATVSADGRPHVAGVGALWVDGTFYFTSGEGTRKSRNLAGNANCAISVNLPTLDLVVEGTASRVTDRATLQRIAERYAAQGWPASAGDDAITAAYSAPSAGPSPWNLYVMTPVVAYGVATAEPYGATRWRF